MYEGLDSYLINLLSLLALWGGVAIILGSNKIGSLCALAHATMMIAFSTNVWTPKVDSDNEVSNLLISMAEAIAALIVLFGIKTEIIFRDKRD